MGTVCDILFDEQELGVVGYICVYCDAYIPAGAMRYGLNGTPRSNRSANGGEENISVHEPECPYCGGHKTGIRVKVARDSIELPEYVTTPAIPRKPKEWTKKGDKWVRPVKFIDSYHWKDGKYVPNWRRKSYVKGHKMVRSGGKEFKKLLFGKKTKAELLALNKGVDGETITKHPLSFWKNLGYVTNIEVVSWDKLMVGYWRSLELAKPLNRKISLKALSRVSRAALEMWEIFGDLNILKADLAKVVSFGAGLVPVYTKGVFHGDKTGWLPTHRKNEQGKPEFVNIDDWHARLDSYHNGELSLDRGKTTIKENKRKALRAARDYLDGEGTVDEIVNGIFDAVIDGVVDDVDRLVPYIDEMDAESSAKPHHE